MYAANAGNMYHSTNKKITPKDKLQALRTILQSDIVRFELLSRGEMVMSVKALNERINAIKSGLGQGQATEQEQKQINQGGLQPYEQ